MGADASVYGNIRPVQFRDPLEAQQQVMTLRALQDQGALRDSQMQVHRADLANKQRDYERDATLADIYRRAMRPDGTFDRNMVLSEVARSGLGARVPTLQKEYAAVDEVTAKTSAEQELAKSRQVETALKRVSATSAALGSLISDPALDHQKVIGSLASLVQSGVITQEQGWQATRELPGRPEQLRQYLIQKNMAAMTAQERLKASLPNFEYRDTGKVQVPVDMNAVTNPNPPTLRMTTTPGQDQSAGVTREGHLMTDKRERELAQNQVRYETDGNGQIVAVPTRAAPGAAIKSQAVLAPGAGMLPLQGKLPEHVSKALMSIQEQRAILDGGLRAVADTPTAFTFNRGVAQRIPFGESAAGRMDTDNEIKARSYVFNVVSKVILERAGTAQSKAEQDRLKSFLPAETDNARQIKYKFEGFKDYLEDMEKGVRVNPGGRTSLEAAPGAAPTAAAPQLDGRFEVAPDIMDILNRNGVKLGGK